MALPLPNDRKKSEDREKPPEGYCLGMCYAIIDLGVQQRTGRYPTPQHQCYMLFELEHRLTEGDFAGQRFGLSKRYALSPYAQGQLYKDIFNWLNVRIEEGMDIEQIVVGRLANLYIRYSDDGKYANITNILPPPKGAVPWTLENGPTVQGWYIPKWIHEKRSTALEKPADFQNNPWNPPAERQQNHRPDVRIPGQQNLPSQQQNVTKPTTPAQVQELSEADDNGPGEIPF